MDLNRKFIYLALLCSVGLLSACGGGRDMQVTVAGQISGLNSGATLTLQDNEGTNVTLSNGPFSFTVDVNDYSGYSIGISQQPLNQNCNLANQGPNGQISNLGNLNIVCTTPTFNIGGSVFGLASGQSVTLLDNGGDALTLNQNGPFTFATPLALGSSYTVTVGQQPTGQSCVVANAVGNSLLGDVSNVSVTCQ